MEALNWGYAIPPIYPWMQSLSERMSGHDISILVDDDYDIQLTWSSPHLNDCLDAKSLADKALALKAIFDGTLFVVRGASYAPFELGAPIRLNGKEHRGHEQGNPSVEPFCPRYSSKRYTGEAGYHPCNHPVSRFVALAKHDTHVLSMLSILGTTGPTLATLYVLLDDIRYFKWDDAKIEACSDAASGSVNRFTGTANNRTASGDGSRHGRKDAKPMKNKPMSLSEAQNLILPAVGQLLDFIAKRDDLCSKL